MIQQCGADHSRVVINMQETHFAIQETLLGGGIKGEWNVFAKWSLGFFLLPPSEGIYR